jgi:hypothetical protein
MRQFVLNGHAADTDVRRKDQLYSAEVSDYVVS